MENYTSIEQSKKLLELGLSPGSADMEYKCVGFTMHINRPTDEFKYKLMPKEVDIPHEAKYDIPCWSVGALIDLVPQTGTFHTRIDIEFNRVVFEPCDDDIIVDETTFHYSDGRNLVEACYNMVIWLLENNYIKKGE